MQEAVAERDAHWQARVSDKDTRIHEVERTARQLRDASERATAASASLKSENEALKLRVMEAEEKLHLEQRRGRTALKERTNTIHYDPSDIAGVVKPKAVHSHNYGDTTLAPAFDALSLRSRGGASTKTASGFSLYSDDSRQQL